MSSFDHSKPPGKSGQRNRKPKQQNKKPDQRQRVRPDQQPDRRQEEKQLIEAEVASADTFPIETEIFPVEAEAPTDTASIDAAVASAEIPSKGTLVPIDTFPVATLSVDAFFIGFQAIANAYRDYTRRSLEETLSFVEKFAAARSLDTAIEVQSEFAKQACGTFVADSQKIWRLYGELARQVFKPFERLVMRVTQTARHI
jgi:phasin family protein